MAAPAKDAPSLRYAREDALQLAYIETNATGVMQSLIPIDRDKDDSTGWAAIDAGLLPPSWTALNPHDPGRGHIVYGLSSPVCLTDAARRPPVNLLARIEHGLKTILSGDVAYTGQRTKNPYHGAHTTLWGPETALYGLRDLAENLGELGALPEAGSPRRNVKTSGVGRNVALFDETRGWAYRAVRSFWSAGAAEWEKAVYRYATEINEIRIANDFTMGPLGYREVEVLANSVAAWVWERNTPAAWKARQTAISHKASRARTEKKAGIVAAIESEAF